MEASTSSVCPFCGVIIPSDAKFCPSCGKAAPKAEQHCPVCGAAAPTDANFCIACGAPMKEPVTAPAPIQKKRIEGSRIRALVRSGVPVLVTLFLLIASLLPIVSVETTEMPGIDLEEPISLRFSAIDLVTMTIDATIEKSSKKLAEDDLTEELEELTEELSEMDPEDLSRSEIRTMERFLWLFIRLSLRSKAVSLTPSMVISVTVSVLYILFAATLFGLSLSKLIRTLRGKSVNEKSTVKLFLLSPFFCLLTYLASLGAPMTSLGTFSVGMAWTCPALILASAAAVFFIIEPYIFKEKRISLRPLIGGTACLILSVSALLLCFGPAITATAKGEFNRASTTRTAEVSLHSAFFQEFEISEETEDTFEDTVAEDFDVRLAYCIDTLFSGTAKDFRNGAQYGMLSTCLLLTAFWWYPAGTWTIFPFIYYAAFFAAVLLTVCAWRSLVSLYDRPAKKSLLATAITALVPIIAYIALDLVFVTEVNRALDEINLDRQLSLGFASAPVILAALVLLLAVFAAILPNVKKSKSLRTPLPYEAADAAPQEAPSSPL